MSHKYTTGLFATSVTALSLYAVLQPNFYLGNIIDLSSTSAYIRSAVACIIALYAFYSPLRTTITQMFIFCLGIFGIVSGVTALFSPVMFGYFSNYIPLGDVFITFEAGVLATLAGLELPARKLSWKAPAPVRFYYLYLSSFLFSNRLKRLFSQTKTASY